MTTDSPEVLTIPLGGLKVAALAWGPSSAPSILALHGWLDNAASFATLGPRLQGHRVVAVDLPGHGLSDHHPPGFAYHFVDWVGAVARIVDELGWQRFGLVGHSMGAGIGTLFAGTFPERVSALVLLDGLGPLTEVPAMAPQRLASGILGLRALEKQRQDARPFPTLDAAASRLCAVLPGLALESARVLLERGLRPTEGGLVWRSDPRMRVPSLFRLTDAHVEAFLERIACPTLMVRASHGWPFDPSWAQRLVAKIPRAWAVEAEGGHHVHLDDSENVAALVRAFFGLVGESPNF